MSISGTTNKHIYSGNGSTHHWPFTFDIVEPSDIELYKVAADGVITRVTTDFTVDQAGGEVVYPQSYEDDPGTGATPPANGTKVVLLRAVPQTQDTELTNQGALPAEVLEATFDKLTLLIQDQDEKLDRCVKFPLDETPTADDTESFLEDVRAASAAASTSASTAATAATNASNSATASAGSAVSAAASATSAATSLAAMTAEQQSGLFSAKPVAPSTRVFYYSTDQDSLELWIPAAGRWFLIG